MTSRHSMPGRPHAPATLLALAFGLGLAAPPAARADTWDDAQADGGTTGPADPACPAPPTRRAADPPPDASSSLGTRRR